ncbi:MULTISPECIES: hypothetical protein [Arthrobacter]|uniref:Uncharacterized protein n=1 Tax=Arthrobacter caoxuetaonis TaxID=2886935 RepID=A0A9X1MDB0_9MICC|nr:MULTISPECIES: hypothetical protein [Arthrobacter]MCC3282814.1 hypothetical protein [Arthrobacter caoxuetaonis]MCC3297948.1 hypothetical protein [Arthrobacter caoxuetaonis]MCC9192258.1 hypothetical protein [Arthrobacter sp. zg-Y916]USQ56963.1 hypothetical protein NF551_14705 [Arthrobacter caoxuetaonis]
MTKPIKKPTEVSNQMSADPELQVNIAPAAARRLSEEGLRRLASAKSAEEANLPGWQSLGKGGKPNHANGRQGPRERKVRW